MSGDYMGDWSFDKPLAIGDKLIFEDMIHYTIVKTNMFNGIPHPSLALWNKDDQLVMYRTFDYEDYNIESESANQVIGQEFDDVVAVIDSHFYYDENDKLATKGRADKVYSQRNMFYQIVTRTRKRLHILAIDNPDMMAHIIDIVSGRKSLTTPGRPETRG